MNATANRQVKLAARPVGMPKRSDWEFVTSDAREPGEGEVLVKVLYLSLDPAMRGWMNEGRSYIPPVKIGEVMRAGGAGVVIASNDPNYTIGTRVTGTFGIQEFATVSGKSLTRVDESVAPLPVYLNVLGMPGITAYFGLTDIGRPQSGDTVVVSGAAGAVGMTVGQVAKLDHPLGAFVAAFDHRNGGADQAHSRHRPFHRNGARLNEKIAVQRLQIGIDGACARQVPSEGGHTGVVHSPRCHVSRHRDHSPGSRADEFDGIRIVARKNGEIRRQNGRQLARACDRGGRLLDCHDPRMAGQPGHRGRQQINCRPARNIVENHRHLGRVGGEKCR